MGQYYLVVNTTKKQFLYPHCFGDGLKLLEFGCSSNGTMTALAVLLANSNGRGGGDLHSTDEIVGSWSNNRIVIVGDYADERLHIPQKDLDAWRREAARDPQADYKDPNLYALANEVYEDISGKVIRALSEDQYILETLVGSASWRNLDGKEGSGNGSISPHPMTVAMLQAGIFKKGKKGMFNPHTGKEIDVAKIKADHESSNEDQRVLRALHHYRKKHNGMTAKGAADWLIGVLEEKVST